MITQIILTILLISFSSSLRADVKYYGKISQPAERLINIGYMIAANDCPVFNNMTTKIRTGFLAVGATYDVIEIKNEYARVIDASGNLLWTAKNCGKLFIFLSNTDKSELLPGGITYKPEQKDNDILQICGRWGSQPDYEAFRILLSHDKYSELLRKLNIIKTTLYPGDNRNIIDALADIWIKGNGLINVFCGMPQTKTSDKLPIFIPRIMELQRNRIIAGANDVCPIENNRHNNMHGTYNAKYINDHALSSIKCASPFTSLNAENIMLHSILAYYSHIQKNPGNKNNDFCYLLINKIYHTFYFSNNTIYDIQPSAAPICNGSTYKLKPCMCSNRIPDIQ